jgi:hypothetical protein
MDAEGNYASYASDVAGLPEEHQVVADQPDWSTDDYVAGQEKQHKGSQDDFVARRNQKKDRSKRVTWFNSPYNKNVATNVGQEF